LPPELHAKMTEAGVRKRIKPSSLLKWIVRICRFGLIALFVFTAVAKIAILKTFATNVGELLSASGVNYQRWSWPVTTAVIVLEICVALLLLWRRTVRVGAVLGAVLLTSFAGYALYYVYVLHGEPLECGCFGGIIASQLGVKTALRNLALLIPAIIVWFGYQPGVNSSQATLRAETIPV
jgi:methylamine utilization protein MauE